MPPFSEPGNRTSESRRMGPSLVPYSDPGKTNAMKKIHFDLRQSKDTVFSRINERTAVRGIVHRNGKDLLVFDGRDKLYEFPGGGVGEDEALDQALSREIALGNPLLAHAA